MALVVTARATAEAQPTLAAPIAPPMRRVPRFVSGLAVAGATWYALALAADAAARVWPVALADADGWFAATATAVHLISLVLLLSICLAAWFTARNDAAVLLTSTVAAVLAAVRPVVGGILTTLELSVLADVADLALALLVVVNLAGAAALARWQPRRAEQTNRHVELFGRVADVTAFLLLAVAMSGAVVRAVGASWACGDRFPDCNGYGLLPLGRDPLADMQLYHRLLAYVSVLLVFWIVVEAFRTLREWSAVARGGLVLLGAVTAQAAIGVVSVSSSTPALTQSLHTLGTTATCAAAVVLSVLVRRAPRHVRPRSAPRSRAAGRTATLAAYVQLTKPRVMSLLLATTATTMVIAARGLPEVRTLIATLVGGALMSGGAGAINHYVDRDIDPLMGRTAWRPIPSGVISPARALSFGIVLAVVASAVFLVFVNPVAWLLAVVGLLGYIFIYTLWLKRSTPSNIVIGGAAGAIPPLVGWAAVTHEISSLTAWYLFAIIFFWTPPHFWALSLLIKQHYERAGVPMLPVVRGEQETRRQIVLYSVLLVALTLVLSPFGMMGLLYFVAAVVLGSLFLLRAARLWRDATPQAARGLYLYSLLYLFALFTAMAVDRVVTA